MTTIAWDTFMRATLVGLVLVGLVELAEHWKLVEQAAVVAWHGVETAAVAAWNWIKSAASDTWRFLEKIGTDIYDALIKPYVRAFDFIKGVFRGISSDARSVLGFVEHPFGLSSGGAVPKHLASGGPSGTDTVPAFLSPGEGVVSTAGMDRIGGVQGLNAINMGFGGAGALGGVTIRPNATVGNVRIDGRTLLQLVVKYTLLDAARGPSNMVGGSIVTGARGMAPSFAGDIAGTLA